MWVKTVSLWIVAQQPFCVLPQVLFAVLV
jgi:hypothetical protein